MAIAEQISLNVESKLVSMQVYLGTSSEKLSIGSNNPDPDTVCNVLFTYDAVVNGVNQAGQLQDSEGTIIPHQFKVSLWQINRDFPGILTSVQHPENFVVLMMAIAQHYNPFKALLAAQP